MSKSETWRDQLRRFRADNRLSQQDIADFLGVAQKSVSRWELGTARPDSGTLDAVRLLVGNRQDSISAILNAIRTAHVPLAVVDGSGKVLAASMGFSAGNAKVADIPAAPEIMLVDNDAGRLRILRAVLGNWGLVPHCFSSGREALSRVASGYRPRAVLIHADLSGEWTGVDFARAVQAVMGAFPVLLLGEGDSNIPVEQATWLPYPISLPRLRLVLESQVPEFRFAPG